MTAPDIEESMLARVVTIARGTSADVKDQTEANVLRMASMLVRSRYPLEAARLMTICDAYFRRFPNDKLPAEDILRNGWVTSLPRLRAMLEVQLQRP